MWTCNTLYNFGFCDLHLLYHPLQLLFQPTRKTIQALLGSRAAWLYRRGSLPESAVSPCTFRNPISVWTNTKWMNGWSGCKDWNQIIEKLYHLTMKLPKSFLKHPQIPLLVMSHQDTLIHWYIMVWPKNWELWLVSIYKSTNLWPLGTLKSTRSTNRDLRLWPHTASRDSFMGPSKMTRNLGFGTMSQENGW